MSMTIKNMQDVANLFVPVMDFPKEGIRFWNVSDLTSNAAAYKLTLNELEKKCRDWMKVTGRHIDYIAGFDARGFIFGGVIADRLGVGFLQIRKKGKLPGPTISESYELEYGTATLEVNVIDLDGKIVVLVDDLLATGGTAEAGFKLIKRLGGEVAMFLTVTELPNLKGRVKLQNYAVESLLVEIDGKLKANVRFCVDAVVNDINTDELVLIDRLSSPMGYAMPGGGIELGESALEAAVRELYEETNCVVKPEDLEYDGLLTGADRDPRGDQVSLVFRTKTDTAQAQGEDGKTRIFRCVHKIGSIPSQAEFAFSDHYIEALKNSREVRKAV